MRTRLYLAGLLACAIAYLWLLPSASAPAPWPVSIGSKYPDWELTDTYGKIVRISDFRGKVILLEPVGMSCPACQAFSGANDAGGFQGVSPQRGIESVGQLLRRYARVDPENEKLVVIQILFFSISMGIPTVEDAMKWRNHFRGLHHNVYVTFSQDPNLQRSAYDSIPGFQLIDSQGVLRADSTGHRPVQSLYNDLMPMLARLLEDDSAPSSDVIE